MSLSGDNLLLFKRIMTQTSLMGRIVYKWSNPTPIYNGQFSQPNQLQKPSLDHFFFLAKYPCNMLHYASKIGCKSCLICCIVWLNFGENGQPTIFPVWVRLEVCYHKFHGHILLLLLAQHNKTTISSLMTIEYPACLRNELPLTLIYYECNVAFFWISFTPA